MASCGAAGVNRIAASFVQSLNNIHQSGLETHGGADRPTGGGGDEPVTKPKTKSILAAGALALAVTASPAAQAPPAGIAPAAWSSGPASAAQSPMDDGEAPASACPSSLAGGRAAPRDDDPDSEDGGESDGSGDDDRWE